MTYVAVLFVGGPIDGEWRSLPIDQHEYIVSELNRFGREPEREDAGMLVRDGKYAWRIHTANPRRFDWQGWKE